MNHSLLTCYLFLCSLALSVTGHAADPRDFSNCRLIPDEGYCDQPYVVVTKDGNWLCTMTTGPGGESQPGQHVVATISKDQGKSWSPLIDIESSRTIESSWVVPLIVPSGRVYAFYNYNGDNIRKIGDKKIERPTLLGWYVYKFSDDNGLTWSAERHRLPMPVAAVDRQNDWQGRVQLFWGVDKPTVVNGDAFFGFTRMGKFIHDLGEGWFYRSDNILTESDPAKIHWRLLPETEHGVRNDDMGSVQEEHNVVPLANGDLYCVYRTTQGYAAESTSRDGGRTWSKPQPVKYADGRTIKTPRGCAMVWRTANGKYLLWIHNTALQLHSKVWPITGRDQAWLTGGIERNGRIEWSQPELISYVTSRRGVSYPDLIETEGKYFISATNKREARLIEVDGELIEGLWQQGKCKAVARNGILLEQLGAVKPAQTVEMPRLPNPAEGGGFAFDFWLKLDDLHPEQVVFDSCDAKGYGLKLTTIAGGMLRLTMHDGIKSFTWDSDAGVITTGKFHHITVNVDGGPKMLTFVIDGRLCDGGDDPKRPFGTGRFGTVEDSSAKKPSPRLGDVTGGPALRLAPMLRGELQTLRLYGRYLRTSEAIANFRAGP